jgi:hypothetical protein
MPFVKLSTNLLFSSIWSENSDTCKVWITMLVMADQSGLVPSTAPGISKAAIVNLDSTIKAIETLEKPDEFSKSVDNDGRRIKRVDGGYLILNYEKYREYSYSLDDRARYMREYRKRQKQSHDVITPKEHSASVSVSYSDMFLIFWKEYPRKVNKKNAERAFLKIKPDKELFEKIMSALKEQKINWRDPQYTPHAATWLNGNRWDDEVDVKCRRGEIRSNELDASEPTHDEKIQHKKNLIAQYGENFKLWPEKWGPMLEKLKAELLELESEQDQ